MAEQTADAISAYAADIGRRGGKARLVKMTREERTRVAKLAAQARWHKKQKSPDPPTDPRGPQHRDRQAAEAGILSSSRFAATGNRKPVTKSVQPESFRDAA